MTKYTLEFSVETKSDPREILDFKVSHNFFVDYEIKQQWVPTLKVVKKIINN